MNQRNVEALNELYVEWMSMRPATMPFPAFLASRGVLVPSTLTDENCDRVWEESSDPADVRVSVRCGPDGPIFRTLLERIAREGV